MAFGKWIGGYLGWSAAGPLGGLIGFLIGALFDAAVSGSPQVEFTSAGNGFQDKIGRAHV